MNKTSESLPPQMFSALPFSTPRSLTGLPRSSEAKCSGSAIGTFPGRTCTAGGRRSLPCAPAHSLAVPGTEPGLPLAPRRTGLAAGARWALYTWWEVEQGTGFRSFTSAGVTHPGLFTPTLHTSPLGENFQREYRHWPFQFHSVEYGPYPKLMLSLLQDSQCLIWLFSTRRGPLIPLF